MIRSFIIKETSPEYSQFRARNDYAILKRISPERVSWMGDKYQLFTCLMYGPYARTLNLSKYN